MLTLYQIRIIVRADEVYRKGGNYNMLNKVMEQMTKNRIVNMITSERSSSTFI